MRIVCQQTILMKYHALVVTFEKQQNIKLPSAANYMWHFMGYCVQANKWVRHDTMVLVYLKW